MEDQIKELEARIARLERKPSRLPPIETSTENEIEKAWPEVSYQGRGDFISTYEAWLDSPLIDMALEGILDLYDDFGNVAQVEKEQECYLGYNQQKDYFVVGFDVNAVSQESIMQFDEHMDAQEEYENDYSEWLDGGEEGEEPDPSDYRGWNEFMDGVSGADDPRNGSLSWVYVAFRAQGDMVRKILDVQGGEKLFYQGGHKNAKRKHNLVDLRLD